MYLRACLETSKSTLKMYMIIFTILFYLKQFIEFTCLNLCLDSQQWWSNATVYHHLLHLQHLRGNG